MKTVTLSYASRVRLDKFLEIYSSGKAFHADDDDYYTFIGNKDLKNPIAIWGADIQYVDSRAWDYAMTTKAVRLMILGWWIRFLGVGQVPVAFARALSESGIVISFTLIEDEKRVV
jgi:hypothetical protein